MDIEDMHAATKAANLDAAEEGAGAKVSLAIPLKPFRASRTLLDDEVMDVNVVGIRFDPVADEWKFVCMAFDGISDIYVAEYDELVGTLPEV